MLCDLYVFDFYQPGNLDAFEDLDIEAISTGMSVAWSMDNVIERPTISRWMTELGRSGDVQEVEVTAESIVGETVAELMTELPEDCHLALLSRDETFEREPDEGEDPLRDAYTVSPVTDSDGKPAPNWSYVGPTK